MRLVLTADTHVPRRARDLPLFHGLLQDIAASIGGRVPDYVVIERSLNAGWSARGLRRERVLSGGEGVDRCGPSLVGIGRPSLGRVSAGVSCAGWWGPGHHDSATAMSTPSVSILFGNPQDRQYQT